jgi:hypothetical protein
MTLLRARHMDHFQPAFAPEVPRDRFPGCDRRPIDSHASAAENHTWMVNEVQSVVRNSEVLAVVRVMRSGRTPIIGDSLDYFIEIPSDGSAGFQAKARKPYRFEVEQWHLDAASRLVISGVRGNS